MDTVVKAVIVYFFLWAVLRLSGRRTLGEMTAFDFVLFLLIGSAMQRALTGQDYSLTNAILIVATLIIVDIALSFVRRDVASLSKILKGTPTIVVEGGKPLTWRLKRSRLTEDEVLQAARRHHGIESLDRIRYAILEASGDISIIPYEDGKKPDGGMQQEKSEPRADA
jgi:uncharacterized membrane protein YcaP (DUF421 family)